MIVLYGKPGCGGCSASAAHLEKLGLTFNRVDVTKDPAAAAHVAELGYSGLPVVENGADHWQGYRPDRIKALVVRDES